MNILKNVGEQIILALRNGAFWLCRFPVLRPLASPTYVCLKNLFNWYWEHVL